MDRETILYMQEERTHAIAFQRDGQAYDDAADELRALLPKVRVAMEKIMELGANGTVKNYADDLRANLDTIEDLADAGQCDWPEDHALYGVNTQRALT